MWKEIAKEPPALHQSFLAYEYGHFYKAVITDRDDEINHYEVFCAQPVCWQPEPTHWMVLPPEPELNKETHS